MTPAEADEAIADFYRTWFAEFGPFPVPGAPGSTVPESEELRALWAISGDSTRHEGSEG